MDSFLVTPSAGAGAGSRQLAPHRVDVWLENIATSAVAIVTDNIRFSAEEEERGRSLIFVRDQQRYRVAHQFLRLVLSKYLALAPAEIVFTNGLYGKPAIVRRQNPQALTFNMAHSGDFLAISIGQAFESGIDLEVIRTEAVPDELAQHSFAPREYRQYKSLPRAEQKTGFFRGWTRKEAYLKALGFGLVKAPHSFVVDIAGKAQPLLLAEDDPALSVDDWQIRTLEFVEAYGCAAAVTLATTVSEINYCSYSLPFNGLREKLQLRQEEEHQPQEDEHQEETLLAHRF